MSDYPGDAPRGQEWVWTDFGWVLQKRKSPGGRNRGSEDTKAAVIVVLGVLGLWLVLQLFPMFQPNNGLSGHDWPAVTDQEDQPTVEPTVAPAEFYPIPSVVYP